MTLTELRVRDLGVIDDLTLLLGTGMTAITGETGAGKTLVVEAIELVVGGKGDGVLVRPGADAATVEARFEAGDDDLVLGRSVPPAGRSRAYVDGRMASVAALAERGADLVDLHGQHAHQSLLGSAAQRDALDAFAGLQAEIEAVAAARSAVAGLERQLAALGGDGRERAREADLLRYQVAEIVAAALDDPDEEVRLAEEELCLAGADELRQAAGSAASALVDEDGARDRLTTALTLLQGRGGVPRPATFARLDDRLRILAAECDDLGSELRALVEDLPDDPARLDAVQRRRHQLRELRRKYGDDLAAVAAFGQEAAVRLREIEGHDQRAAELSEQLDQAEAGLDGARRTLLAGRTRAAPELAAAIEAELRCLAMPRARLNVEVAVDGSADGSSVIWMLAANPGEPALPLARVASGGELARVMLAARLALLGAGGDSGVATLVFDEVDAGVGGEAAVAVGRALAALATRHQVLVVTHLPQVAAFADDQVAVTKEEQDGRTVARARRLAPAERVVELSRMLAGQPGSEAARRHAEELLSAAGRPVRPRAAGRPVRPRAAGRPVRP